MNTTNPPRSLSEAPPTTTIVMDNNNEIYPTPRDNCYDLSLPPQRPLLQHSEEDLESFTLLSSSGPSSDWLSINEETETHNQAEVEEYDDDAMEIDQDSYVDEKYSFEDELKHYALYGDEIEEEDPTEPEKPTDEEIYDLDPNDLHTHILTAATKTCSLLSSKERELLTLIKSRKDEATLGFLSPSHGYHPYLGPSCLRNATSDRLFQFLNSSELAKIQVADNSDIGTEAWRRRKARALMRTLYARAIREKETEFVVRDIEKQEREREEMRRHRKVRIGGRSGLFEGYEIQIPEVEEPVGVDELLKLELDKKTEKMGLGERREYLRKVYGARWTWYAMKSGLHVALEADDVLVRSEKVKSVAGEQDS